MALRFRSLFRSSSISQNPSSKVNVLFLLAHLHNLTSSSSKNEVSYSFKKPLERSSLAKFLEENCRSGSFALNEALYFFYYMINMKPLSPISSFTTLFSALAKKKHHHEVISLYKLLNSTRSSPDLRSLNVLMNCLCNIERVLDCFAVLGGILKKGFSPNAVTFNCLIKGLCVERKIMESMELFKKMIDVGCRANVITCNTLIGGLCKTEKISVEIYEAAWSENALVDDYAVSNKPAEGLNSIIMGLAYMDFADDAHLTAAVGKNKQMFVGKKISIARSNLKQKRKEFAGHGDSGEHAQSSNQTFRESRAPHCAANKRSDNIQLKGRNTFAMPRNVRPLGVPSTNPKSGEVEDEKLKSNNEFREMFLKK